MEKIIRKYRKSKGFTLVELLIVIIIIGILAGMMMLAAGAATDKAEATKIVANMRNIKAAAIMYYSDYNTWATDGNASLDKYLDQAIFVGAKADARYDIAADGNSVTFDASTASTGIKAKLNEIATSTGGPLTASGDLFYLPIKQ